MKALHDAGDPSALQWAETNRGAGAKYQRKMKALYEAGDPRGIEWHEKGVKANAGRYDPNKPKRPYKPGKFFTGKPCKHGHIAERWNYNGMCVECKKRQDRPSNLKAAKKYHVKKKYGLTLEHVDGMMINQDHKCAICDMEFPDDYKFQIDHCHTTGNVRGLLCITCNWILGRVNDNPETLRSAAKYLEVNR
jgi:hypothetical protein